MRARVRIRGITRPDAARQAVAAGADALGLVFYASSPRAVSVAQAQQGALAAGPFVTSVGLFVNAEAAAVRELLNQVPTQLLQCHGEEDARYSETFEGPDTQAQRLQPSRGGMASLAHQHGRRCT